MRKVCLYSGNDCHIENMNLWLFFLTGTMLPGQTLILVCICLYLIPRQLAGIIASLLFYLSAIKYRALSAPDIFGNNSRDWVCLPG